MSVSSRVAVASSLRRLLLRTNTHRSASLIRSRGAKLYVSSKGKSRRTMMGTGEEKDIHTTQEAVDACTKSVETKLKDWEFFKSMGSPKYHVAPMVSVGSQPLAP